MPGITLQRFQSEAIDSGVALFLVAKEQFDAAADATSRDQAARHNGCLLIEAPTGSGKTLMAGHIVERFSKAEDVVWFWFAPFKGVVGQTEGFLREHYAGLRLRELSEDRAGDGSRPGDVFVTTWQTVATRVKDRRNVRKDGELNPSVDSLAVDLRRQGWRIGVVVDEAHHSFHGGTEAARFFHEVLSPEYTILVTATPDDRDIAEFEHAMGIAELHRIRISREDAVDAGLIKSGVKGVAYLPEADKAKLVDLEATALRDAVATHRRIKRDLETAGVSVAPLLLVQVDSRDDEPQAKTERSVQRVKERLLSYGFTEDQIAIHTAKEPDAGLLALANDDRREVLVFKMAVALGFDAPRAFVLVSMRATRDPDFGVQLVGRILRVHRLLQARARTRTLPESLRFGYVFLADPETQEGLDIAGQRINRIRTEYAKASPSTIIVRVGDHNTVQYAPDGQFQLIPDPIPTPAAVVEPGVDVRPAGIPVQPELAIGAAPSSGDVPATGFLEPGWGGPASAGRPAGAWRYPIRPDAPRRFKTQIAVPDNAISEENCAARFIVSARDLLEALKNRIGIQRRTLEVFTHQLELDLVGADIDPARLAIQAQRVLLSSSVFDPKALRAALERKVQTVMREELMDEAEDLPRVRRFLNCILASHPNLLHEAQKAALAATAQVVEAGPLPEELVTECERPASAHNIYGVHPEAMNSWEQSFADLLDTDGAGIVRWWHRNLPGKSWSVNVLLADGRGFYPDFVVGIEGRATENGVLLADPKWGFDRAAEAPKAAARHQAYGRVLVLHREGEALWMVVRYDELQRRALLDSEFRLSDAVGF